MVYDDFLMLVNYWKRYPPTHLLMLGQSKGRTGSVKPKSKGKDYGELISMFKGRPGQTTALTLER